jgi:hypothetical protein
MPIYKATIQGRSKPLLIRADTAAKGVAQLVTVKALTAEEMAEALGNGDKVWTPGEDMPEDDKPAADPDPKPPIEPASSKGGGAPQTETE